MNSLDYFFKPKNIAIIGASHDPGKIGHVIMENFITSKFKGKIVPVNPKLGKILDHKVYASIKDVPYKIDLAVICVPAEFVPHAVIECGKKKVKALIIISAGFHEIGNEELTKKLAEAIKKFPRMRVIGPNCLGVMHLKHGVDTLFLPSYRLERPHNGRISFISQSGALGSAILDWASLKGYGISKFISYGNAMDVDEADLLEYLGKDKETKVIAIYLEGVKHGRKFFEKAKIVAKHKPVIFIKGGITEGGAKATQSHTGALAGSVEVYKAMVKQTGMINATTMEEVFDYARVFDREPVPKGDRVQIITNGGGYGVLATDAVLQHGLKLAEMTEEKKEEIKKNCPPYAVIKNPIDLTGDADNKRYKIALEAVISDPNVDSLIVILLFQVPTIDSEVIEVVQEIRVKHAKPMLVVSAGGEYSEMHKKALEKEEINTFSSAFNAAKSLKALTEYYLRRNR